ncbi:MAG: glycosyltransferase [Lachnospiraceae bacterium]
MTKVFFIINCFSKGGGAESLLTSIVNNLDKNKYQIGIMEIIHDNIKKEPTNPNVMIYPYYVEANAIDRKERMYYVYHEWDKVIYDYIPNDYDIYISFNYLKPSFLLPKGNKNIAWIHGDIYDLNENNMFEEKELQREALKKANKIVAISDITKKSIIDLYPEYAEKINVIYNGIDIDKILQKSRENCSIKIEENSILAIGRLDDNKNPIRLLEIFNGILNRGEDCHLYYLGYGVLANDVIARSKELRIDDRVHLLGYHDNPFPIIKQCKVVSMMSKSEGFGLAMLEGLVLGKPFVAPRIGAAEMLSNGGECGTVINTDDEAIDAFIKYLKVEDIGEKCRQSAQRFSLNAYIQKIEELLDCMMEC